MNIEIDSFLSPLKIVLFVGIKIDFLKQSKQTCMLSHSCDIIVLWYWIWRSVVRWTGTNRWVKKKQPRNTICVRLKRSSPHHGIRNPPVPPRLPRSKIYVDISALRPRLNSLHLIWTRDHQNFVLHMYNILRSCPWNVRNQSPSWSISRKWQYRDQ